MSTLVSQDLFTAAVRSLPLLFLLGAPLLAIVVALAAFLDTRVTRPIAGT